MADFSLLLKKGMKAKKVLLINILSALAMVITAGVFFVIGKHAQLDFAPLLGIVAGFFIYIAASDLVPSLHHDESRKTIVKNSLSLLFAVFLVGVLIWCTHSFTESWH
jgi:zinc and cadmium transporter